MTAVLVLWCVILPILAYFLGREKGRNDLADVFHRSPRYIGHDSWRIPNAHTGWGPAPVLRGYVGRTRDSVAQDTAAE